MRTSECFWAGRYDTRGFQSTVRFPKVASSNVACFQSVNSQLLQPYGDTIAVPSQPYARGLNTTGASQEVSSSLISPWPKDMPRRVRFRLERTDLYANARHMLRHLHHFQTRGKGCLTLS